MLTGELVALRGIERDDIEQLHAWDSAHDTWPEVNWSPYVPKSLEETLKAYDGDEESPYRAGTPSCRSRWSWGTSSSAA